MIKHHSLDLIDMSATQTCLVKKLSIAMQYSFYSIPKPTADNVTAALRRSNSSFLDV
jgi:hypothetical protein